MGRRPGAARLPMATHDEDGLRGLCAPSPKEGRLDAEVAALGAQLASLEKKLGRARRARRAGLWKRCGERLNDALEETLAVCGNCLIPVAHLPMTSIGSRGQVYTGEVCVCRVHHPMLGWGSGDIFCSPPCARAQGVAFHPQATAPDIDGEGGGGTVTHPGAEWCGPDCGGECLLFMLRHHPRVQEEETADESGASGGEERLDG